MAQSTATTETPRAIRVTAEATDNRTNEPPIPFPSGEAEPLALVLDEVNAAIKRYVHFASERQAWAVTLWAAHTHLVEHFDVTPRLAIRAPSKQSGKTRLMEVLREIVARGWHITGPSAAVLYRKIAKQQPTILLDEADRLFGKREEDTADVLQVINAGHAQGSMVPRVVGAKHDLVDFPAYAAMALAGIGTDWPDTVLDRSVIVNMERKKSDERVERLRKPQKAALRELGDRLGESLSAVQNYSTDRLPSELSDRAQDGWEALLAIAEAAGGDWPSRAWDAAIELSKEEPMTTSERPELLALRDMRAVFASLGDPTFVKSELLLIGLRSITESGWNDEPRPLTLSKLGHLMRTFKIHSVLLARGAPRGYLLKDIDAHWGRLKADDERLPEIQPPHEPAGYPDA